MIPVQTFPALAAQPGLRHAFLCRARGIDVRTDREEALRRLASAHEEARRKLGFGPVATARQVHGNRVLVISALDDEPREADGLITNTPGVALGVYVADCSAVYLVDPVKQAIGLLHSGSKGTRLNIAGEAVKKMAEAFGSRPADIVAQLSPCIRPPLYELDFAAEIARQLCDSGVRNVSDCGDNTGADPERYYSYRVEKGRTGRMLAILEIEQREAISSSRE